MTWKVYRKPSGGEYIPYPMVTIGKSGISFNRAAMTMIEDMKMAVIMLDKKEKKVGFWFFRNEVDKSVASNVYNFRVEINDSGEIRGGRINCSKLMRDVDWLRGAEKKKFPMMRDNNSETMNDFYVVDVSGVV